MQDKKTEERRARRKEELEKITEQLEEQLLQLFQSGKYADFLKAMGNFWNYSLNNQILIWSQFPEATAVASYRTWKSKFHRQVKKGEHGIHILVPMKVKRKMTEEPCKENEGKTNDEESDKITIFKIGSVFDVSQTEGEPLPSLGIDELKGSVERYESIVQTIRSISPVPIRFDKIRGRAKGYFDPIQKEIVIKKGLSQCHTVHTMIHEMTHAMLNLKEIDKEMDRATNEVIAESTAYAVCSHLGIDTSEYSCGYIVSWSDGRGLNELKQSMQIIRDTASKFIDKMDREMQKI